MIHKTPIRNEKTIFYAISEFTSSLLHEMIHSRFIADGVYGIERYSGPGGYCDDYVFAPVFDKKNGKVSEITFKNENLNEIALLKLTLTKPLCLPLDTNVFVNLLHYINGFSHSFVYTQVLFCKRQDNWRETAIRQYESYLRGIERPLKGKFMMKVQEKILGALTKLNNYSNTAEIKPIEEIEQKILSRNYRFECRFLLFDEQYTKEFLGYIGKALVKLQLFNEITIQKVKNKKSFLDLMEKRQFQTELIDQILSESELFSLLSDNKPLNVQKAELEKTVQHLNVAQSHEITKKLEENNLVQKASSFMPHSENKVLEVDESKIIAINHAFQRVGIVKQPLEISQVYQGASLLKVQMHVPPEITYTTITKKLMDVQGAMGNKNITVEIGDKPDTVNIFIPLDEREPVYFNNILKSQEFQEFKKDHMLPFIIGENINGGSLFASLTKLRHLLIAGTTGSGKSVFINLIILCLILSVPPEQLMLYLIDPKMVEFSQFKGFPQVKAVITDMKKANGILMALITEMEQRYKLFSESGCRDIQGFNLKNEKKLPYIVCVIDELADLMMVNRTVEEDIVRICQKARGAGIHLVIATQRPSVDVVTGLIKVNMPSRIAFAVSSGTDSKTILDSVGAEKLLGLGDGLAKIEGTKNEFERFQGPVLTLNKKEEEEIYDTLKELFEGVVIEGGLEEEAVEESPVDQLKRMIANTGETRIQELARLMTMGNTKVQAMVFELVNEGWLKKEGRGYVIAVEEEELKKWRDSSQYNGSIKLEMK
jgi:S-DNA-T family DNA segregation ATPase FtsK/SpoIIIE